MAFATFIYALNPLMPIHGSKNIYVDGNGNDVTSVRFTKTNDAGEETVIGYGFSLEADTVIRPYAFAVENGKAHVAVLFGILRRAVFRVVTAEYFGIASAVCAIIELDILNGMTVYGECSDFASTLGLGADDGYYGLALNSAKLLDPCARLSPF